jgi:hypothetical protein
MLNPFGRKRNEPVDRVERTQRACRERAATDCGGCYPPRSQCARLIALITIGRKEVFYGQSQSYRGVDRFRAAAAV